MRKRRRQNLGSDHPTAPVKPAARQRWLLVGTVSALVVLVVATIAVAALWRPSRGDSGPGGGVKPAPAANPAPAASAPHGGTGPAPEGMAWIPGGEFTMGSADPRGDVCGGHEAMADARPLHGV